MASPRRRGILLTLLPAILPAVLAAQAEERRGGDGSASIEGVVLDRESGGPLEGVAVTLRRASTGPGDPAPSDPAITDEDGRFRVGRLAGGRYAIVMERIGYRTLSDSLTIGVGVGLRVEAALVQQALELEPLLVVATARARHMEANGFYRRREQGLGRFFAREDIEARAPMLVTDLLRRLAGVRVVPTGRDRGSAVLMRGGCRPEVYLDGIRMIAPVDVDALLRPDDLDGIEVYRGAEVPARFSTSGCGTMVFWTRLPDGGEGRPLTWRRVLAVLGFIGAALLLTR